MSRTGQTAFEVPERLLDDASASEWFFDVARRAGEVFGSADEGLAWLVLPNRALGDVSPREWVAAGRDPREVENVLGRLEHGVFS